MEKTENNSGNGSSGNSGSSASGGSSGGANETFAPRANDTLTIDATTNAAASGGDAQSDTKRGSDGHNRELGSEQAATAQDSQQQRIQEQATHSERVAVVLDEFHNKQVSPNDNAIYDAANRTQYNGGNVEAAVQVAAFNTMAIDLAALTRQAMAGLQTDIGTAEHVSPAALFTGETSAKQVAATVQREQSPQLGTFG